MNPFDKQEDGSWMEVSDEDGHVASLRPIATVVYDAKVYSLMGAMRVNDSGEQEGGLVLVKQNRLLNGIGTKYEVVSDEKEVENVMGHVVGAIVGEMGPEFAEQMPGAPEEETFPHSVSATEFDICDEKELLQ